MRGFAVGMNGGWALGEFRLGVGRMLCGVDISSFAKAY